MSRSPEIGINCAATTTAASACGPKEGVRRLNPLEQSGWDKLVTLHPSATFFHSTSWAAVLHDTYGHRPNYFCAMKGDRLAAALPVMEVNSPLTGRRGVSLPFTDECGLLSDRSTPARGLLEAAIDFGRSRKWRYLECRGVKEFPARAAAPALSFFGHVLPLSEGEDRIFASLDGSVRRGIRKARMADVRVEVSRTLESVRAFYALHCTTRRRHGLPPQPVSFFWSIFQNVLLSGRGLVVVASHRNRPIAAAMFFHLADKAVYKFGASDSAFQQLRANNLVMWAAIQWYSGRGYDSLHFGRTSIANEGLRRFKLGFGAEEYKIDYFKYHFAKDEFVGDRDRVSGWYNRVFRLMPMPLSRLAGALLYRHLS